jgi:hypothetical protein
VRSKGLAIYGRLGYGHGDGLCDAQLKVIKCLSNRVSGMVRATAKLTTFLESKTVTPE